MPRRVSTIDSVPASMDRLRAVFNPVEAAGVTARLLFVVSGTETQQWTVAIADGRCDVRQGADPAPTVTLRIPEDVWLAMARGEKSGRDAFMNGEYQVEGDVMFMMRFGKMFPLK
jgi:putative sterol carrier protein